jgi:hypothetical protein
MPVKEVFVKFVIWESTGMGLYNWYGHRHEELGVFWWAWVGSEVI